MDLKSFINKNEGGEFVKESVSEEVTEIKLDELENEVLDVKIEVPTERTVTEKSELNFVGSFNYVPDPIEYNEGSIYKNVTEGVAYIRKGLLWEELVRDGKPGRDAARVGGSGVGVAEVKSITGMLGIFDSKEDLDKVPTTNLKIGTIATLPSGPVTWRGASAGGWVADAQIEQCHPGDICIFGNSIIGQNGGGYALNLPAYYNSVGFCVLAAVRLNGRARIVENLGIGGENSLALVARLEQLKQSPAGTVVVMESTNDAALGVSASVVFPRYLAIADACVSAGKQCVICTGIPRTTMTEAYKTFYAELRDLILSNSGTKYVACDTYPAILESGTGAAISGTLQDGVHPNSTGALLMSSPLVETLENMVPERDIMRYPVSLGRNKLAGQFFEGSGTSVPAGWSVQSAPTNGWTYAQRPDSTGKLSAVASGDFVLNQNVALTQVGRTIRGYLKMKITGLNTTPVANSQRVTFVVQCYNGSVFTEKAFPAYWDTGAGYGNLALEGEVEFRTNPIEIPTGTTLVQASISAGGGGGTYQLLHAYLGDDVE